jgi:anaerobic selenocysteine-containing dehydrogenase
MSDRTWIGWPVFRQLTSSDKLARGAATRSRRTDQIEPRIRNADRVVKSVCPYCAVGCGQNVYVSGEKVIQIEGDPDSPVSRGRLCPKGSASLQLTTGSARQYRVKYRRPFGKDWEDLDLGQAMDMIADLALVRPEQAGPARNLAVAGAGAELVAKSLLIQRLGPAAEPYQSGRAGYLMEAAEILAAGRRLPGRPGIRPRPQVYGHAAAGPHPPAGPR